MCVCVCACVSVCGGGGTGGHELADCVLVRSEERSVGGTMRLTRKERSREEERGGRVFRAAAQESGWRGKWWDACFLSDIS